MSEKGNGAIQLETSRKGKWDYQFEMEGAYIYENLWTNAFFFASVVLGDLSSTVMEKSLELIFIISAVLLFYQLT